MSPSKQWALGWRDADISAGRGGHRNKRHGSYVLYDVEHDRVAVIGKLERPNRGAVADNGIFILQDWHFGEGLQGTLVAFASDGSIVHKRRFEANLFNGALSANGTWAICQTANNPDHTDGNRLTAFDLRQSREMFSVNPQTGWADSYKFSADGSRFIVVHNDLGKFAYDGSGNFLDGEASRSSTSSINCTSVGSANSMVAPSFRLSCIAYFIDTHATATVCQDDCSMPRTVAALDMRLPYENRPQTAYCGSRPFFPMAAALQSNYDYRIH